MSDERPAISPEGAERFEAGMKEFLRLQQREKVLIEENGLLTKSVRLAELERDKLTLDLADAQVEVAKARAEAETALIARVRYEEGLETIRQTLARLQPPSAPLTPTDGSPPRGRTIEDSIRATPAIQADSDALRPPAEAPDAPHNSVRVEEVTRAAIAFRDRQRLPRGYDFEPVRRAPEVDLDKLEDEITPRRGPIPQRLVVYRRPEEPMREPGFIDKISDFAARLAGRPTLRKRYG